MDKNNQLHIINRKEALMFVRNNMYTQQLANEVDLQVIQKDKIVDSMLPDYSPAAQIQKENNIKNQIKKLQKVIKTIDAMLEEEVPN